MITLTFLLSSATAHAKPSFGLTESSARAGDLVHFTITGVDGDVAYVLEVGDTQVWEGTSDGVLSGTFTVPDLGDSVRTVTVEAEIRKKGKEKKVESDLDYLGSALPVAGPPAPSPAPALPVAPPAAPSPAEAIYSPEVTEVPSPASAKTPQSRRRHGQSRKRHALEPPRHVARRGKRRPRAHGRDRRKHHAGTGNTRSRRAVRGTAPLFDGSPEPGPEQHPAPEPTAPRRAVLVATNGRPSDGGGAYAAIVVPVLLGLAALALAGTAVLRRRRLASRRGSD